MGSSMGSSQDDKAAAKEAKQKEKQDAIEKETQEAFAVKQKSKGQGSPLDQLKVWLDNTPFKSQNSQLKMDTFLTIMQLIMSLNQQMVDGLCGKGGALNEKQALTLGKYCFKAFDLISDQDQAKKQPVIAIVQNGQPILKVQLKIKEKLGNVCFLKYQFEKHEIV